MDQISLDRIAKLHPKIREEARKLYIQACNVLTGKAQPRVTFTLRTFAEQNAIYAQGRTRPGNIVTNAKAGQSLHNYGLALDFCLIVNGREVSWSTIADYDGDQKADWMEVVAIFVTNGWTWGADWDGDGITRAQGDSKADEPIVDAPHLQKTFGYHWRDLLKLHDAGKIDAEGYVKF